MNFVTADVSTWAVGSVASVAQFILCPGSPGKRFAVPTVQIVQIVMWPTESGSVAGERQSRFVLVAAAMSPNAAGRAGRSPRGPLVGGQAGHPMFDLFGQSVSLGLKGIAADTKYLLGAGKVHTGSRCDPDRAGVRSCLCSGRSRRGVHCPAQRPAAPG